MNNVLLFSSGAFPAKRGFRHHPHEKEKIKSVGAERKEPPETINPYKSY